MTIKMDVRDDPRSTYKLLKDEFIKRSYLVEEEEIENKFYVTYKSPKGKTWKIRAAHISYPCITDAMRDISRNKERAYEFAEEHTVSVPLTRTVTPGEQITEEEAFSFFARSSKLIVKPSDSSLSRGLTLEITEYTQLLEAIKEARMVSDTILIQQQVEGEEVRFTVIDGRIEAALLRQTARVIGDGVSTVAKLIEKENEDRKLLKFEYISYPQLDANNVDSKYLSSELVLSEGEILELNRATMIKNGCSIYNVIDEVHPSYVAEVERLVASLGARFVVVDFFIKDYVAPLTDDNYWFIEFNTSPVLKLFYACRDGKMFDIVPRLVTSIDRWIHAE